MSSEIIGAIYPVPKEMVNGFFSDRKKIFFKFLSSNSTKLRARNKILLYASGGPKKVVGEGTIETIEFLYPYQILSLYRSLLPVSEEQFESYIKNRQRRLMVVVLKNLKKYNPPIPCTWRVSMTGMYITSDDYDKVSSDNPNR